jgi:hypothetical protein
VGLIAASTLTDASFGRLLQVSPSPAKSLGYAATVTTPIPN